MATISLTIPDGDLLNTLIAAADEWLDAQQIDRTTMTTAQRVRRYIAGVLRDVYIHRKRGAAESTAKTTIDGTETQARTDAGGIA